MQRRSGSLILSGDAPGFRQGGVASQQNYTFAYIQWPRLRNHMGFNFHKSTRFTITILHQQFRSVLQQKFDHRNAITQSVMSFIRILVADRHRVGDHSRNGDQIDGLGHTQKTALSLYPAGSSSKFSEHKTGGRGFNNSVTTFQKGETYDPDH
uniref:(northern house mosquito) hypothetical protein n=1 Tax=Culex pipiens TaxID=7175 RepID=A0A8D8ACF1_CULPI